MSDVSFGQATRLDTLMAEAKISGILGLWAGPEVTGDKKTLFDYLVEQRLVDQPVFSVWLEKKGTYTAVFIGVYTTLSHRAREKSAVLCHRKTRPY